ncbi:hypothetical protein K0M31_012013 [Melipona bicolor]|uniref:Uncharacterized protein n=1 Tax=Melipona bicolor TaxID=60889 RepID=A0AA40GBF7_9HYME|nr:hypothetical protein K0M31_012013 [Melipona bicolor]
MTGVRNEGNRVSGYLVGRFKVAEASEGWWAEGAGFSRMAAGRCRRDTGARTRPQLGGPGVDEQRRGRALCKADFKFRCGPPCPHTSTPLHLYTPLVCWQRGARLYAVSTTGGVRRLRHIAYVLEREEEEEEEEVEEEEEEEEEEMVEEADGNVTRIGVHDVQRREREMIESCGQVPLRPASELLNWQFPGDTRDTLHQSVNGLIKPPNQVN